MLTHMGDQGFQWEVEVYIPGRMGFRVLEEDQDGHCGWSRTGQGGVAGNEVRG